MRKRLSPQPGTRRGEICALRRQFPREYLSWKRIKQRCHNPKHHTWPHYGGRGITVCEAWRESFAAFLSAVGPRPSPQHSIERINVDGNYEPSNVKWADRTEQARNRRSTFLVEYDGQRMSMAELAERSGVDIKKLWRRIVTDGWPVQEAVTLCDRRIDRRVPDNIGTAAR